MEMDIPEHYAAGTYFVIAIFLRPLQARMPHSPRTKYTLSIVQYPWQPEYIRMFMDWHEHVAILLLFNETSDFLAESTVTKWRANVRSCLYNSRAIAT